MRESPVDKVAQLVETLKELSEGFLEPEEEFRLRIDTLDSMMDTARSIVADLYSYSRSYDEELGEYSEVIETIQELLVDTAEQVCAISEDLEERYGEDEEGEEYSDDAEETGEED